MSLTGTGRGQHLLARALVWDNHGCMPLRRDQQALSQLARYRQSGVDAVSLNIGYASMDWTEHLRILAAMRRWIARHEEDYLLAATSRDIERAKDEGRLAIVFDIEGMGAVEKDLNLVQVFYELGVRWMLIAYNRNNRAGGGCLDDDGGLTQLGRAIIDEMERVGMVLCLSHVGARTARDALDYATAPAIFSHVNPYGVARHVRNVGDELLQACAAKGGVIGLSGVGPYLGASENLVEQILYHLRYVIDLVGAAHVGLGLDYVFDTAELDAQFRANPHNFPCGVDGGLAMVAPEDMPSIAEGLARDNLNDDEIAAVLGGNWMRIARQVWKEPRLSI